MNHGNMSEAHKRRLAALKASIIARRQQTTDNRCQCIRCVDDGANVRKVDDMLAQLGMQRVPIRGDDNNCQFRALASFVKAQHNETHDTLRQQIVDYIEQHPDRFQLDVVEGLGYPSLANYCARMRRSGTWGDGVTLMAFALMSDMNVHIATPSGISELYPGENRRKLIVVRIGDHYEATKNL